MEVDREIQVAQAREAELQLQQQEQSTAAQDHETQVQAEVEVQAAATSDVAEANAQSQDEEAQDSHPTTHQTLESHSNMIELSIQTQQKQPAQQEQEEAKGVEVVMQRHSQLRVSLVVKDHTNVEEALKLVIGSQILTQNIQFLSILLQQKGDVKAHNQLIQLVNFMQPLVLNLNDVTYSSKVKRATEEFTKVATSSPDEDAHYTQIKQVILDLLSNSNVMEASHLQQLYMHPMMMSSMLPGGMPAGVNQILAPQSSISVGSLAA